MNRQRYMAELSKLLAFMFKEDKDDILAQYNRMLDEAADEQAMLESFGSPTKLAVTISRTYKRSERKLAVEADSKEDEPAEGSASLMPAAGTKVKAPEPAPDESLSYADIIEEIRREKAKEEGIEYKPIFFDEPEESTADEEAPNEIPDAEQEAPAETSEETAEQEAASEPEQVETETQAPETEQPESEVTAEVETERAKEEPDEAAADEPDEAPEKAPEEIEDESVEAAAETQEAPEPDEQVRYKTNAALLILYLIVAIPVGLALVAVAIIAGLALLAAGAGLVAAALKIVGFAFSMFNIFADIMLCAGAALIAFSVALIVIWLGILMFAKVIGGIVRGIKSVGRAFCVKEVSVDE